MQASPCIPQPPLPSEKQHGAARWSKPLPANSGKHEGATSPFTSQSINRRSVIISTAFPAILALLLVVYLCHSRIGLRKSNSPVTRRLASSDPDKACQELLELTETDEEVESRILSSPTELLQGADLVGRTSSRTSGETQDNIDEDAEQAKKLLFEESHNVTERLQGISRSPPDSSEASSAQEQAASIQEIQISAGFQRPDKATISSVKTTPHGAEPLEDIDLLEPFFTDEESVEQWFLDYILHSSPISSLEQSVEPADDPHQPGNGGGEPIHEMGVEGRTSSAKRRQSADDQGDDLQQAKKLRVVEELRHQKEGWQRPSDPSPGSPSGASSAQQQASSSQEIQPSGGLQGAGKASQPPLTKEFEAAPYGPVADMNVLENLFAEEGDIQQGSFGYSVDAPSASLQGSSVEQPEGAHQFAGEQKAHEGYELTPSKSARPEHVSSAAHGSVSGGARLRHSEIQGVQGSPRDHPGVSTGLGSSSRPLHGSQPPVEEQRIRVFKNTPLKFQSSVYSSAASTAVSAPQTSAAGEFPSTSPLQEPKSLQTSVSAREEAQKRHPFYRLPRAAFPLNVMPFSYTRASRYTNRSHFPQVLASIRDLLLKDELQPKELQALILLAEQLVKAACSMANLSEKASALYYLQEPLTRRFLIADALWGISEVAGPLMQRGEWWNIVMDRLLLMPNLNIYSKQTRSEPYQFATRVIAALRMYREGRRPPPREVIELKRRIFCYPRSPHMFRSREFEKFRDDGAT